jgi:hypothetical protein
MADTRGSGNPPASGTPEDTAAIPAVGGTGRGNGPAAGNGRVLPPPPNSPPPSGPPPTKPTKPAASKAAPGKPAPRKSPRSGRSTARRASTTKPAAAVTPAAMAARRESEAPTTAAPITPAPEPTTRTPAKAPTSKAQPKKGTTTRKARLRMTRVDPWSVMKTAFLLSIALGIVLVVAVFMVWSVLDAADVWASINQTVEELVSGGTFDIEDYLGTRRVVGFAMIVAAVDVVLLTAIATLGAFLYNMSASLLGGIEVTLAEDK